MNAALYELSRQIATSLASEGEKAAPGS
jgi:hypothetical protein